MDHYGEQGAPRQTEPVSFPRPFEQGPLAQGSGRFSEPYNATNLAVQRSIMEIFDDFAEVVTDELRLMKLDDPDMPR